MTEELTIVREKQEQLKQTVRKKLTRDEAMNTRTKQGHVPVFLAEGEHAPVKYRCKVCGAIFLHDREIIGCPNCGEQGDSIEAIKTCPKCGSEMAYHDHWQGKWWECHSCGHEEPVKEATVVQIEKSDGTVVEGVFDSSVTDWLNKRIEETKSKKEPIKEAKR